MTATPSPSTTKASMATIDVAELKKCPASVIRSNLPSGDLSRNDAPTIGPARGHNDSDDESFLPRKSSVLHQESPRIENQRKTIEKEFFRVTIVGFGRYGKNYIGPKYIQGNVPYVLDCIVDPFVAKNRSVFRQSIVGSAKPTTCIFEDFQEWHDNYFCQLAPAQRRQVCIDIAVHPNVLFEVVKEYVDSGVKFIILPKPIAVTTKELRSLCHLIRMNDVTTAVASQWHYSSFISTLRKVLNSLKIAGDSRLGGVERVSIEFSKEDGADYHTHPPLLELPHCIQILFSCGLLEAGKNHDKSVSGSKEMVEVHYTHPDIPGGVNVVSNLALRTPPEASNCRELLGCGMQKRTLEIYLQGDAQTNNPSIFVDFWVKFDKTGEGILRNGSFCFHGVDLPPEIPERGVLSEDQLKGMINKVYDAFLTKRNQDRETVDTCSSASTVNRENNHLDDRQPFHMVSHYDPYASHASAISYEAVGAEIAQINEMWRETAGVVVDGTNTTK